MTNRNQLIIEFRNKHCKNNNHQNCQSKWNGFGFDVVCNCECHLIKKEKVLDETPQSATNTRPDHSDKYGDIRSE